MACLGILGGMGPMATADFIVKFVEMTPAARDQEHIPYILVNLPQIPDRTQAILGQGANPLPMLFKGVDQLIKLEVEVIAIPCNTCHHWYEEIAAYSPVPVLDMPKISVERVPVGAKALVLATAGTVSSGFFQAELEAKAIAYELPSPSTEQAMVDRCIQSVKAGCPEVAGDILRELLLAGSNRGVTHAILACTELPIALKYSGPTTVQVVDTTEELARAAIAYAVVRGWNLPLDDRVPSELQA
jgi:aspartate racemase